MKLTTCSHRPILVPCRLKKPDYQVDPYIGCAHCCHYCYALNQAETDWSEEIQTHEDIKSQLSQELEKISPQNIYAQHFSVREGPWHFREGSVGGGTHARAPAEFFVGAINVDQ